MSLGAVILHKINRILVKGGIKRFGWSVFPQESGLAFRLEIHLGDYLVGLSCGWRHGGNCNLKVKIASFSCARGGKRMEFSHKETWRFLPPASCLLVRQSYKQYFHSLFFLHFFYLPSGVFFKRQPYLTSIYLCKYTPIISPFLHKC